MPDFLVDVAAITLLAFGSISELNIRTLGIVIPALAAEPAPGLNGGISQLPVLTLVPYTARLPRRSAAISRG